MNVEIIRMDKRLARVHYLDYRERVRKNRENRRKDLEKKASEAGKALHQIRMEKSLIEREDEELLIAYRALTREQRIINVESALIKAGVDSKYLPRLAIGRADWETCYFWGSHMGYSSQACVFAKDRWVSHRELRPASGDTKKHIHFRRDIFSSNTWNEDWRKASRLPIYPVKAVVPLVPAQFRPDGDLSDYHLLWEPVWEPVPPVDPILLKKISSKFYVVLAQWDLTEVERSVLTGRL